MTTLRLLLLGLALAACTQSSPTAVGPRHGVLVVAIDALRADRMSLYGYDRETTPFLDSLVEESLVFDRCYSVAPEELPAHVALLTGCDPRVAERRLDGGAEQPLFLPREELPRLARSFLAAGHRSAAFSDSPVLGAQRGFGSGFEEFYGFREGEAEPEHDFGLVGVSIRFKRWLRALGEDESWFAYLQVRDLERIWLEEDPANDRRFAPRPGLEEVPPLSANPTSFFAVPRRRWNGGASTLGEYQARYEGNVREVDQTLGRLVAWLQRKDWWDTTTLVVIGTYGLSLGEEGLLLESGLLDEANLRVPLLIRPARGLRVPAARVDALTASIDVAPTLLELCRIHAPEAMHGVSQHEVALRGSAPARERVFAAGGLFDGFAVVGADEHFLRVAPDSLDARSVRMSYFGTADGDPGDEDAYLVELRAPGTWERLPLTPEHLSELSDAGAEWFRLVRATRDAVQGGSIDAAQRAELTRRGLLAPEPGP